MHSFDKSGVYDVKVMVKDNTDDESRRSKPTSIWVSIPSNPEISGPTKGIPGESYTYKITSTDPDDDPVWYNIRWEWANYTGWLGPYDSGKTINFSHTWTEQGDYLIRTRAKDIHGILSGWSTLEISMPKSRIENNIIQLNILQPKDGFIYFQDTPIPILPFGTIIIGPITVVASAVSLQIIDKIEFYVDDVLKHTENDRISWIYTPWVWDETVFFKHTLKVIAYDRGENIASDEIVVWRFL